MHNLPVAITGVADNVRLALILAMEKRGEGKPALWRYRF
ncbi:hypothetical protein [Roseobacter phage RDJL3]|nr:hypothetical protein [Roseobacter phage RDJL3]